MSDNDAIGRLSKKLDAGNTDGAVPRSTLFPKAPSAPSAWPDQLGPKSDTSLAMAGKRRPSRFALLFVGSGVFFLVAVGIAALLFFSGSNIVSTKNVDLEISGPASIGAGDTLSLQVVVTNRNSVPMQLTDLVIEFPPDTRSASDISVELPRIRESLGTVNPGESVNRTVKAVLFGTSGTQVSVDASVEYRVPSSNAIFVTTTTYAARISQSPATISVTAQNEVVSGQGTSLTVTVTSNAPQVLKNVLLLVTYPPGFAFQSADPASFSGTTLWSLGDIEPAGARSLTIRGVFTGEDGDQRTLTFTAGNKKQGTDAQIAAPLATASQNFTLRKPFISAGIVLDNSIADQHTIQRGRTVNGGIEWTNNLPIAVQNLSVELNIQGQILNGASVKVPQGFFSSANSSILWDKSTRLDFANVAPGESGTLAFSFATLPVGSGNFRNPALNFTLTVHANRASEGNVPTTVDSSAKTTALVATDLALTASLSHIGTAGPIPPKVNNETVYIVSWTLSNSANALANTAVTAVLPSYVRFIGATSPVG
ncbi:MAG: hypothetical protein Q7R74_00525, partial [bacterium]|nr:hypothetical protein [bacterium]